MNRCMKLLVSALAILICSFQPMCKSLKKALPQKWTLERLNKRLHKLLGFWWINLSLRAVLYSRWSCKGGCVHISFWWVLSLTFPVQPCPACRPWAADCALSWRGRRRGSWDLLWHKNKTCKWGNEESVKGINPYCILHVLLDGFKS